MDGRILGHYRIDTQLGAGGMGVYRARDQRLERDVALKVLPPGVLADEAAHKRFRKEALALSQLNHPNVATGLRAFSPCRVHDRLHLRAAEQGHGRLSNGSSRRPKPASPAIRCSSEIPG